MSTPSLLRSAIVAVALLSSAIGVRAAVSPVSLRVELVNGTKPEKFTTTQTRSLKVILSNNGLVDQTGLKVKYYYFTRGVKDRETVLKDSGEKTADVKAHATQTVETPEIKASFTESHSSGNPFNNNNNRNNDNRNNTKKVEATGERIVGHGAQLFTADGQLLTEYFSEPSLKALVGGGAK